MTASYRQVLVGTMLMLGSCTLAGAANPSRAATPPQPLGEWTTLCNPAFKVSAMPNAWSFFPGQGSLVVTARLAIDFELLSPEVYTVNRDGDRAEGEFDLSGFDLMVMEAEVRHRRSGRVVQVLPG